MKKGRVFISVLACTVSVGIMAQNAPFRGHSSGTGPRTVSAASLAVPERAREHLLKAVNAHIKNNNAEALTQANAALQAAPEYPEALTFRAMLEIRLCHLDEAMEDLQHALRIDPNLAIAHLHVGSLFNRLARYDDALRSLTRNEDLSPATWASAFETAKAWLGKHQYTTALAQLDRSARLGGDKKMASSIHMMRGDALYGLERYEEARTELKLYLTAEPNGALAGVAHEMLDRIKAPQSETAIMARK